MTRDLTGAMQTEVAGAKVRPVVFVKFEFDSGDELMWSGYRPFTFLGEVYTGAGNLLEISGIQETQKMKASEMTFSLSGINAAQIAVALAEDYQGRPVTMWFGALDANDAVIDDAFRQFKGELDVMTPVDDGATAKISVTAVNDLVDLERPRLRRFNDEDQELDYPNDRFFEFVPGLQEKEIVLGPLPTPAAIPGVRGG